LQPLADLLADHHHDVALAGFGAEAADHDVAVGVDGDGEAGLVDADEVAQADDRGARSI
jgi:hypothetical protein